MLIVDDEDDVAQSFRDLLADAFADVRVETANSGPAALAVLQREPVDVLVSDYRMPGMDGLELLIEARRVRPGVKTVMVTAFGDLELAVRAVNEAGVANFLTKPVSPDKMIEVISGLLATRRGRTGGRHETVGLGADLSRVEDAARFLAEALQDLSRRIHAPQTPDRSTEPERASRGSAGALERRR